MFRASAILLVVMANAIADTGEMSLRKTLDSIQGEWNATSLTESGSLAGSQRLSQMSSQFQGDVMSRTGVPEDAVRLSFDVTRSPMTVEWIDRYAQTTQGVVQVKQGRIDMCYSVVESNGERTGNRAPTEFKSTANNKATLVTFEKKSVPSRR